MKSSYKKIYENMSIFTRLGAWLSKAFKSVKDDADKIAIAITEEIQAALKSGSLKTAAQILEDVLPSSGKIPEDVVAALELEIPKILAFELAVQGLPDSPTPADIQAFETAVLTAFGASINNSKLWTTLAAQFYSIIETDVNSGAKYTFAECVIDIEKAYQDYLQDVKDESTNS